MALMGRFGQVSHRYSSQLSQGGKEYHFSFLIVYLESFNFIKSGHERGRQTKLFTSDLGLNMEKLFYDF